MKAIILAGGKGTRGKPYTDYFPKAMTPVGNRPLIDHIVRYVSGFEFISEVVIISDFEGLGGQIKNYYLGYDGKKLSFIQDSQRGTGGDLLHAASILDNSEFVLWFADNLCAIDLEKMTEIFRAKKSTACIATRSTRHEETGFAIVKDDMVQEFVEKPTMNLQMPECLGIYVLGAEIIKRIKSQKKENINLSYDILQYLSKEKSISAFDIGDSNWIDVESPAILERNQEIVKKIIQQMESRTAAQTV